MKTMTSADRSGKSGLQNTVAVWIENSRVQVAVTVLIIINAIILGLETDAAIMASYGGFLLGLDKIILAVFVIEILLRLFAYRTAFFRDPWSLFDFAVVAIALIPTSGPFAVLRALRVLRVLRILTIVPSMRRVVGALLNSIPGLGSIAAVLMLIYYVFAVIATNLFGQTFPHWFGTLGESLYSLFQIMTLESWSMGIVRPLMEVHPFAWIFFITFILIATFTMLNLFIAIIVNAMNTFHEQDEADKLEKSENELQQQVSALREEIRELKQIMLADRQ